LKVFMNMLVGIDEINARGWHGKRGLRGVGVKEIVSVGTPVEEEDDGHAIFYGPEVGEKRSERIQLVIGL